jgi:hypothetical protein
LYSYVRFAAAASLIAFGSIIGVGALVLVPPAVERLLLARAEISHPPREVPSLAEPGPPKAGTIEVASAAESVSEQPLTEAPPRASAPQAPARQADITAPEPATPVPPPAAEQRRSAKPVIRTQARSPAPKKATRRDQAAKRSTSEALRTVRRFGDTLQDIPVSAYAGDGQQRTIIIRPTSVQDVYYYSVRR